MTISYKVLAQVFYDTGFGASNGYGYGYGYGGGGQDVDEFLNLKAIYTVPASTETVISSIFVTNLDSVDRTYDLAIVPSGQSTSLKHHIRWDKNVSAKTFDIITAKITLSAGDKIYVLPSTLDKFSFTVFGLEKV
jgi:hypothetical protein